MHRRIDSSFFLTNNTSAPQGDALGRRKPLSKSWSCNLSSFSSAGAMRSGALEMGPVPGSSFIPKSTAHGGGIPRRSSGRHRGIHLLWVPYLLFSLFL